jgi:hypothetical protein
MNKYKKTTDFNIAEGASRAFVTKTYDRVPVGRGD